MIMKPKLRVDAIYDMRDAIVQALEILAKQNHIYKCCLNCEHFNQHQELCKLANARPPARVIVFGCELWEDQDGIPF